MPKIDDCFVFRTFFSSNVRVNGSKMPLPFLLRHRIFNDDHVPLDSPFFQISHKTNVEPSSKSYDSEHWANAFDMQCIHMTTYDRVSLGWNRNECNPKRSTFKWAYMKYGVWSNHPSHNSWTWFCAQIQIISSDCNENNHTQQQRKKILVNAQRQNWQNTSEIVMILQNE